MILKERIYQKEQKLIAEDGEGGESSGIADGSATSGTSSSDIATVDTCLNFAKKQQKKHYDALGTNPNK